ncbi:class I SAM-dependent methyltransferase [Thalassotalea sp. M1531]|uniref:Class I SAM-dependent methyltransferase n=1 Tax=Thalassotalea algicola TaxID=2716224 RepID=A0A7Y0Q7B2_9GAMM|nr:class I SAM-dependent methyltransferase [Thalassotalea algicola]NMP32001.1 class I SAM-dependent methyltransferase [Thalassotalea algicola]
MEPSELAKKYDKIAGWWHQRHQHSNYGVKQFEHALSFSSACKSALDVGCGAGGRFIRILEKQGCQITGVDASTEMITLAKANHPHQRFVVQDICTWNSTEKFDFIYAWDSMFHLPLSQQKSVITKLCGMLTSGGILMYTFGNDIGAHTDNWLGDIFYYSSIGINENINTLITNGLTPLHLALDQYPEKHVYVIAKKP